jgi:hypothetical protein
MIDNIVQIICPILDSLCALGGVILGIIGIKMSLPKISKQIKEISQKIARKRFDFCGDCPFASACTSPHLDDAGDFDKITEIGDDNVEEYIRNLYETIQNYAFEENAKIFASKEHKDCLLRKITMATNLLGSTNMSFNLVKDHIEIQKKRNED